MCQVAVRAWSLAWSSLSGAGISSGRYWQRVVIMVMAEAASWWSSGWFARRWARAGAVSWAQEGSAALRAWVRAMNRSMAESWFVSAADVIVALVESAPGGDLLPPCEYEAEKSHGQGGSVDPDAQDDVSLGYGLSGWSLAHSCCSFGG